MLVSIYSHNHPANQTTTTFFLFFIFIAICKCNVLEVHIQHIQYSDKAFTSELSRICDAIQFRICEQVTDFLFEEYFAHPTYVSAHTHGIQTLTLSCTFCCPFHLPIAHTYYTIQYKYMRNYKYILLVNKRGGNCSQGMLWLSDSFPLLSLINDAEF